MALPPGPVRLDDAVAARDLLGDVITRTPMLHSWALSERLGGPVYLKCENLQRTGSFKVRGAYTRIARLPAAQRAKGVVAASAGNHAQGVAFAANALGTKATVVMPEGAPLPKVEATRSYGADVVFRDGGVDGCITAALALADDLGAVFIHPFDHQDTVAGNATLGMEIVEQCPQVRTIAVAVGGGGLISGVAVGARGSDPAIRVIGVQAEAAASYPVSLAAGHPVPVELAPTMADGIAIGRPGDLTFGIVAALVEQVLTVSEDTLSRALLLCLERAKQLVEPAGAAAVAALLDHPHAFEPPAVLVLSGGNIDPMLLSKVLRYGLTAAGRYLAFRCRIPDRPGGLATLLAALAGLGANVLDVMHERVTPRLRLEEVEVALQIETRGPAHSDEVISCLRGAGYTLIFS
jgi:threonine dehydratase